MYAYVRGAVLKAVDPLGLQDVPADCESCISSADWEAANEAAARGEDPTVASTSDNSLNAPADAGRAESYSAPDSVTEGDLKDIDVDGIVSGINEAFDGIDESIYQMPSGADLGDGAAGDPTATGEDSYTQALMDRLKVNFFGGGGLPEHQVVTQEMTKAREPESVLSHVAQDMQLHSVAFVELGGHFGGAGYGGDGHLLTPVGWYNSYNSPGGYVGTDDDMTVGLGLDAGIGAGFGFYMGPAESFGDATATQAGPFVIYSNGLQLHGAAVMYGGRRDRSVSTTVDPADPASNE